MKLIRTKFLLSTTLLLTLFLSGGCGSLIQKLRPGGLDFGSLDIDNPKVAETFETAKANNKNVLLIFDAVWCGYCRKFNQLTMKDAEVKKTLSGFEVVNIDVDKYPKAVKAFEKVAGGKITGVPTLMIFSSNGNQTARVSGYFKAKGFNRFLKKDL